MFRRIFVNHKLQCMKNETEYRAVLIIMHQKSVGTTSIQSKKPLTEYLA